MAPVNTSSNARPRPKIWWSNAIFFIGIHIAACVGIFYRPLWSLPRATFWLSVAVWQAACYGITMGYHRLYSHRAYRAVFGVRLILATLGSMAFQGSIKSRAGSFDTGYIIDSQTIRYTTREYSATRGLLFSHMGWIFFKPQYDKMPQIERDDLDSDPVVRFQHDYYVPLALFMGVVAPTLVGSLWNDASGAFIWGSLVSRLAIWHCTFLVNSLAHWDGLQPYSDEDTSRGNFVMALLTCGEGNHNFHAFPYDFRAGPSWLDWDPSKWIILLLHRLGMVSGLRRARPVDIARARTEMAEQLHLKLTHSHAETSADVEYDSGPSSGDSGSPTRSDTHASSSDSSTDSEATGLPLWDSEALARYVLEKPARHVILIDGFAVDVTHYVHEHPGGAVLLRKHAVRASNDTDGEKTMPEEQAQQQARIESAQDASAAFHGGMNKHSRSARLRARELRVARMKPGTLSLRRDDSGPM